ncbi:uncharacterized protein LOC126187786 [Schistocerca cancellata]|uniref:uncharacterized protein LOC126187786 n=1 Tax=Schistocerca cancellata TaxID=274614 RepID=UPI002118FA0B|nr:uncharacterized protein LOC126187786 [Schistocerca cancellata]
MATDEVPRLVDELPAPCKAVTGDVTLGDRCLVLRHPDQQGLLADLRNLAESAAGERRPSEGYDSSSGICEYDLEPVARKDSLDSCFSSYNSGDLADVSRKLAFGFDTAGVTCTVECEESLEQRYEAVESCSVAEYSESESDSSSEDGEENLEWPLAGDRDDGHITDGEEQPADEVIQSLSSLLHRGSTQKFESLTVTDSEAVHVGNVTYILGEVNVKQVVQETSLKQQVFVSQGRGGKGPSLPPSALRIISRKEWLAQPPLQPAVPVTPPLNLVVINHTATEASTKMMTNMMLCRRIQLMHVEGNEWWDIGYNYLVGMDGYIYEGRGWGLVGAHTYGYNSRSLGVAFIGCFMQHVPTPEAVAAFHQLVELGVREGHLTPDCRVMGNCQCTPNESPGRAFYELMKTWPRWAETPPPPPWDSATKQPGRVGTASERTNDRSHVERECTAEKSNASADSHVGNNGTFSPLTPHYEFHLPKTVTKPEGSGDCSGEQRAVLRAEAVASSLKVTTSSTVSGQSLAFAMRQGGGHVAESSGDHGETLTERSSESHEVVSVSSSRNVHLGGVNYVLGPLSVNHVLQRSSVERSISVTRPDQDSELCLVQREEWGAHPTKEEHTPLPELISRVIICHTETSCGASLEQEVSHVQQLQVHALHSDLLQDIRYNFLVGASGYVFEGRGWQARPAVARGYDDTSLGVAFIGNFKTQPPTPEAVEAFHQLMALGEREGHLSPDWRAMAQCQLVTTDSPGRALYQLLKGWPRWAGPSPSETAGLQDLYVVSRDQWLASPPAEAIPKLDCPVRMVVICHTGTKEPSSVEGERRQVRSLQDFEVQCRGRADLPFHFVVAPSGTVYEGRGWELAADLSLGLGGDLEPDLELDAPDDGSGRRCLAVALLGTFCRRLPASPALDALPYLLAEAERRRVLTQDYRVVGHCQLATTSSPGGALFSLLKTWPRWTDRPFDDGGHDADESDSAPGR